MFGWRGTAAATLAVGVLAAPGVASADSPIGMCVPSAGGAAITTPTSGSSCPAGSTFKQAANQADLTAAKNRIAALEAVLTGITRSTVNGRMTLRVSGENVQIVNGTNDTFTSNGLGNLLIGYNSAPRSQTGSHNIMLGSDQSFTSWGSIVGGAHNTANAAGGLLLGNNNKITDHYAAVTGGYGNVATSRLSSITGGCGNTTGDGAHAAEPVCASTAGQFQSVTGGRANRASGTDASIAGGNFNTASGSDSSVSGGYENHAVGTLAAILGGCLNVAGDVELPNDPGSCSNEGVSTTVAGGAYNDVTGASASAAGGAAAIVSGNAASVLGGFGDTASGVEAAILGGQNITLSGDRTTYPAGP